MVNTQRVVGPRAGRSWYRALVVLARAAAAGAVVWSGGCAGGGSTATNPDYLERYTSGKYSESLSLARTEADRTSGARRERAALTAGLSAYAMDRDTEAEQWLRPLVDSSDKPVAGQASATLGLIAQRRGDHERAAELLRFASDNLPGADGARAAVYAGDSLRALGQNADADELYGDARRMAAGDPELTRLLQQRAGGGVPAAAPKTTFAAAPRGALNTAPPPPGTRFTVSLGAFSTRPRAEQVAAANRSRAVGAGLGEPRIVEVTSTSGVKMYAVRVGQFFSRTEAERNRARFGRDAGVTLSSPPAAAATPARRR